MGILFSKAFAPVSVRVETVAQHRTLLVTAVFELFNVFCLIVVIVVVVCFFKSLCNGGAEQTCFLMKN